MYLSSRFLKVIILSIAQMPLIASASRLTVNQPTVLQLQFSKTQLSMQSTGTASLLITATPVHGTRVADAKGCGSTIQSGLPAGITASWSQPVISRAGAVRWKLTLTGSNVAANTNATLSVAAHIKDVRTGLVYSNIHSVALNVALAPPTLTFSAARTPVEIVQGTEATDVFSFTAGGSFQGSPQLSISGLPTGITASWSSTRVVLNGSGGTSTLTLAPKINVAAQKYRFTVTASGDGLSVAHDYTLTVKPTLGIQVPAPSAVVMSSTDTASTTVSASLLPGVSVARGGTGCSVSLVSNLPRGIMANWSQPSTSYAGKVQWTVTFTGSPSAIGWSGWVVFAVQVKDAATGIVFTQNQHLNLTINFVKPTLSVYPSASEIYLGQGSSATDTFSFTGGGSYHGSVAMSVSGLPSGVTTNWSQNPVDLGSDTGASVLTLSATPTLTAKVYSFTVTATGDGLTVFKYLRATVEPLTGVSVQVAQPSIRVAPGVGVTLAVTATALYDVTSPVTGSGAYAKVASQLPDGVSAQWSQPSVTKSGKLVTWQLTLSSAAGAVDGIYPVKVSATVTDQASGMQFSANQQFSMFVSLLARVSVGTTAGNAIASDFVGLSQEWGDTYRFMGSPAVGVNQAYRQLLTNLTVSGSSPANIRMGGNSTDVSIAPSASTDAPLADLATALHTRFILGVNLGSDAPSLAVTQAQNDVSQMPAGSIEAVEIGNEPDLYHRNGFRPSTYSFQDYLNDFDTWKADIDPLLPPGVKFSAPAWASTASLSNLPTLLDAEAPSLSIVTQHYYVGSPSSNPAPDYLLAPRVSTIGPNAVAAAAAEAHASGLKFRMGELGSISGAGVAGISDAFGSALWAVDTMFEYANVGVDGVNWETSSENYNAPFYFQTASDASGTNTTYTLTSVTPLYYGMLFFQKATGNHSSLLPVTVDTTANFKCWPTVDSNGTNRLTILNKDDTQSGTVMVTMPGYNVATIIRLTAPSYTSTSGVTFGGQTFDGSTDGNILGTPSTERVEGNNAVFAIPMPITSAALVVFSN